MVAISIAHDASDGDSGERHRFRPTTYLTFSKGSIAPTRRAPESQAEPGLAYPLRNGSPKLTKATSLSSASLGEGSVFRVPIPLFENEGDGSKATDWLGSVPVHETRNHLGFSLNLQNA
jgi:hypothetical protein